MQRVKYASSHAGIARGLHRALLACALLLGAAGAGATVNDPPYVELYPGGNADPSVNVCGIAGCDASSDMIVTTTTLIPAGSGYRDTFLRIQHNEGTATGNADTESGYNTDNDDLQRDPDYENQAKDTNAGNKLDFNHAVLVGSLEATSIGGIDYYQILLDINEGVGGGKFDYLKLDEFEVHLSTAGTLSSYNPGGASASGTGAGQDGMFDGVDTSQYVGKVFDMDHWWGDGDLFTPAVDAPAENCCGGLILKNSVGTSGSGDEDYLFSIPVALFNATATGQGEIAGETYMHIVASFGEMCVPPDLPPGQAKKAGDDCDIPYGDDPDAFTTAGFEEFTAVSGVAGNDNQVPAPGTAILLGLGLLGLFRQRPLISR